ncbi:putative quinate utilization oxidoreductase QutH [Sphaerosporella brunnea]|uniref:Putative quinate utilization oxidoreductase QutH n=1 Tax=Sphaerosporella brunnea TaxID=1250544 RepID=A0A5J5EXB3_9PEZI|nr:putative quinate utilization oxidoreductase QutH [Sphaerosporella brunnea]
MSAPLLPPVNITVIGATGLIGRRHVSHIISEPSTRLTCIVEPTSAGAQLAEELSIPHYPSLESLLLAVGANEVQVDAAIIATPNATHVPLGILCVKHGLTCLIEKPLAVDAASAKALLQAMQAGAAGVGANGAKVLTGHHRRHNSYIRAAKAALDTGVLGEVIAFQGVWALLKDLPYFNDFAWRRTKGSGGPVLINLIHEVDNLRYLFGDVERVFAEKGPHTRGFEVEETVAVTLRFCGGLVGTFVLSDAVASPWNWEMATGENPLIEKTAQTVYTIMGTKGSLSLPEMRLWTYEGEAGNVGSSWLGKLKMDEALRTQIDDEMPFARQLRDLVDVHRGVKEPVCGALEGARSLAVVEAVIKSLESGMPVEIEKIG